MATTSENYGKWAVITGASSGIGYELGRVFAKNGFNLLVAAEDDGIFEAATGLAAVGGTKVLPLQVDLSDTAQVETLYAKIKTLGPIDSLVVNAGFGVDGNFIETDWQKELSLIKVNIISLVQLTKLVLPDFVKRGEGRILFTSSLAAQMPGPYYAVYAASKSFVESFAQAIRFEVKDSGVTITALQPGATDTNFFARADMLDTKAGAAKKDDPAQVAEDGYKALMSGADHVVAGSFMNKVQAVMGKILPETVGASMQAKQTKPGSANE